METPDGPDGSCAGDAPEVAARAATSASASASRDAAAPSAPAESLSRRLYASVSSMFGARGGTGAGSATSDASASARDTTPDADDGGWFNPEAFTVEKRQWLAARRARERGRSASDGGGSGMGDGDASLDASRVGERARDASSADASRPHGPALFDHFLIVGLPTNADVSGVAASARAAKAARGGGCRSFRGRPSASKRTQRSRRGNLPDRGALLVPARPSLSDRRHPVVLLPARRGAETARADAVDERDERHRVRARTPARRR